MCVCVFVCVSVGTARSTRTLGPRRPPPSASKPNFTVLQRKSWHRSLHSITRSHNSQSRARRLMHSYTQAKAARWGGAGRHFCASKHFTTNCSYRSASYISTSAHFISSLYLVFWKEWAHNPPSVPPPLHRAKPLHFKGWPLPGIWKLTLGLFQLCTLLDTYLQSRG